MSIQINKEKLKQFQAEKSIEKKYTILVVDDELSNVEALTMILEKEYNVIQSTNGFEALSMLEKDTNPLRINLIISDQRMPGMKGVEFLKQTISIMPKTIRIILTGFTDVNDIIDSINEGQIYKFLTKPIEPKDLLVTIKRALESYELEIKNIKLLEELNQMNQNLKEMVDERTGQLQNSLNSLEKKNQELEYLNSFKDQLVNELQHLSFTDSLTGLGNRRKLEEFAKTEWERSIRNKTVLSIVMMDIDHFKLYNDSYGHVMGDTCIKSIAKIVKMALKRPTDLAVRYGGEEFCCILPETDLAGAIKIGEDLLELLHNKRIPHESSKVCPYVTLSIGISSTEENAVSSWEELLHTADEYLYKAKNSGRNKLFYGMEGNKC